MKKVLAICLMMAMVLSISATAFAAPNGFVSSPSGQKAPGLVAFVPDDAACTARLVITPYGDRNDLPDDLKTMMEKAYSQVTTAKDLTTLNAALAKLVSDKGIKSSQLAISDLFDIHVTGCDYHDEHVDFDVVLDADMLSHFVGLLHMNKDGVWELVSNAHVNDSNHLQFSVDSFSPFAIVVNYEEPKWNGDDMLIPAFAITMAVSALAVVYFTAKSRKQRV